MFKVDFAVDGGIPWTNEWAHKAGTVHLAGTIEQLNAAEKEVRAGRMPERPFVLLCQQYLADPGRSVGDIHPIWAYAHVPQGYSGDATEAVIAQIERFAPGFRERIVATSTSGPAELEAHNANYLGGDIAGGANDAWQVVMRPRASANPYSLGVKGLYICSASTPPGAGVHGMGGFRAAHDGCGSPVKTSPHGTRSGQAVVLPMNVWRRHLVVRVERTLSAMPGDPE